MTDILVPAHRPAASAWARVHLPLALGAIVAGAAIAHAMLALRLESTWIIPDELIYSELAQSLADGGPPSIRGEQSYGVVGLGYPAVLAPVSAIFSDTSAAYAVARALNALVLALTALPAYFLARQFVRPTFALLVAVLAVSVPSMLYAGTLMTEVVLYPVFVSALLAMVKSLVRPRAFWQVTTLVAIAAACTIKVLAVLLVPAYVAAILIHDRLERRSGARAGTAFRSYAPTWGALSAASVAAAVGLVVSGHSPQDLLGAYSVVLGNLDLLASPWWAFLHLAELDLYLAVIPFALTAVVVARGLRRHAERRDRLFAAVTVPVAGVLIVAVGAFASTPSPGGHTYPENVSRLHERSTFVLAPLFFIGLAIWLDDRRSRTVPRLALAAAAVLPLAIPLWRFDEHVRFQALALVPWVEMRDEIHWPIGIAVFTATLALLFVLATRMRASPIVVLTPVVFVLLAVGVTAHVSMREASLGARAAMGGAVPDWVDQAVERDAKVSVLWAEPPGRPFVDLRRRHYVLFVGEFFNRSIGRVYELGSPLPYALPSTPVRLRHGRVVREDGTPARLGQLVLAPCWVRLAAPPVVRDALSGAVVYRPTGVVRARVEPPESCT